MKALPVEVLRSNKLGDCTNGGISSRYDDLLVLCDDGFIDVNMDNPPENLCVIEHRFLFGRDVYHMRPYTNAKEAGWMSGGNFAYSCDSRFSALIGQMYGAVSIHDRQETWELYDKLSR
jgi:hypothetical protein